MVPVVEQMAMRRKLLRMTRRDLAESAGVSQSTIERMECGSHAPRLPHIEALARAMGCDVVLVERDHGMGPQTNESQGAADAGRRRSRRAPTREG